MAALAYRDDRILARNLLSHPFFCLTPAEPFFRPDRSLTAPSCRVAVKDGRAFRGHPKGLSLTAASTMARWRYRGGRRPCVAAEHVSSPRRSSRLPGSRSRSLYRNPGTPIGKPINYLDFATIKLPAPAYLRLVVRYGRYVRLNESRLKIGRFLFLRHGGKIVLIARLIAVLRVLAPLLAGVNRMRWRYFFLMNAIGGICWASLFGGGAYLFGEEINRVTGPVRFLLLVIAVGFVIMGILFFRHRERELEQRADAALRGM